MRNDTDVSSGVETSIAQELAFTYQQIEDHTVFLKHTFEHHTTLTEL
jgi:hypothetical protein